MGMKRFLMCHYQALFGKTSLFDKGTCTYQDNVCIMDKANQINLSINVTHQKQCLFLWNYLLQDEFNYSSPKGSGTEIWPQTKTRHTHVGTPLR